VNPNGGMLYAAACDSIMGVLAELQDNPFLDIVAREHGEWPVSDGSLVGPSWS